MPEAGVVVPGDRDELLRLFENLIENGMTESDFEATRAFLSKFVSLLTKKLEIPCLVSLNPIMIDGTGMCGGCRVEVGGETKFACVDGPEFDGHKVNFDLLLSRQRFYVEEERCALERYLKEQQGAVDGQA